MQELNLTGFQVYENAKIRLSLDTPEKEGVNQAGGLQSIQQTMLPCTAKIFLLLQFLLPEPGQITTAQSAR
ncbi:hypothetical protein IX84_06955 [Phaeodactylibacter xiamenensis]|uniref:Uncharacterized protein n=1 Tax=Phaeodactylibacter xiamenensis TaxID=1524460 RepID=A0A098S9R2_9BACT|nr:hypothetical protein IX84_06955 [Phaeodactylibacter xiamenensis]